VTSASFKNRALHKKKSLCHLQQSLQWWKWWSLCLLTYKIGLQSIFESTLMICRWNPGANPFNEHNKTCRCKTCKTRNCWRASDYTGLRPAMKSAVLPSFWVEYRGWAAMSGRVPGKRISCGAVHSTRPCTLSASTARKNLVCESNAGLSGAWGTRRWYGYMVLGRLNLRWCLNHWETDAPELYQKLMNAKLNDKHQGHESSFQADADLNQIIVTATLRRNHSWHTSQNSISFTLYFPGQSV